MAQPALATGFQGKSQSNGSRKAWKNTPKRLYRSGQTWKCTHPLDSHHGREKLCPCLNLVPGDWQTVQLWVQEEEENKFGWITSSLNVFLCSPNIWGQHLSHKENTSDVPSWWPPTGLLLLTFSSQPRTSCWYTVLSTTPHGLRVALWAYEIRGKFNAAPSCWTHINMERGEIKHNKKFHQKGKTRKSQWLLFHSSYWWNPGWQVQLRLFDLRVKKVSWIDQSPTLGGTFLTIIFYSSRFALCEVLSVQCTQVMPSEAMFQFMFQMKDCVSKSLLPPGARLPDCGLLL